MNIGGLSLARLLDRREAFAVQLALGAGRVRLAIQLLAEAMLIGAAAALIALPVARWSALSAGRLLWTGYRPQTLTVTPLTTTLFLTVSIALRINGADATSVGALVDLVSPGFLRTTSIRCSKDMTSPGPTSAVAQTSSF